MKVPEYGGGFPLKPGVARQARHQPVRTLSVETCCHLHPLTGRSGITHQRGRCQHLHVKILAGQTAKARRAGHIRADAPGINARGRQRHQKGRVGLHGNHLMPRRETRPGGILPQGRDHTPISRGHHIKPGDAFLYLTVPGPGDFAPLPGKLCRAIIILRHGGLHIQLFDNDVELLLRKLLGQLLRSKMRNRLPLCHVIANPHQHCLQGGIGRQGRHHGMCGHRDT